MPSMPAVNIKVTYARIKCYGFVRPVDEGEVELCAIVRHIVAFRLVSVCSVVLDIIKCDERVLVAHNSN